MRGKRFSAAAVIAGVLAGGMMLGTARLEAKGGKGGGGGVNGTICDALLAVITYKYVSPAIKDYATSLYLAYECDPSLLP